MSPDLEFSRTDLAAPDSLAGRLIAGRGPVILPSVAAAHLIEPQRASLSSDAFGTTSPALATRLERVLAGEGFVVTTGQQPILFLGPLYVLYKALTAIELARVLEEELGAPVVPVFWIASDDHDWEEIGQTTLLDREGNIETLRLAPPEGFEGRAVGPAPLGPAVYSLIHRLSELLPPSEFTDDYLELFKRSYSPQKSLGEAFAEALSTTLRGNEFAWLDSANPAVKRAARPFFDRMFADPAAVLDAMTAGAETIAGAGFDLPIATIDGGLPLFYDDGTRRSRVFRSGDGFRAGRRGPVEDAHVWRARVESEAERFSPNVSSRPILESRLMPVAATVLGPGEIAYWSQLPPLFEYFDVRFPAVVPRASWLVIEPRVRRILDQLALRVGDLTDGGEAAIARLTEESRPRAVEESIDGLRGGIARSMADVEATVAETFPGLKGAVGKASKGMFAAVTTLARQVDDAVREREDNAISKVRRTAGQLFPGRRPQERVLSPLYFLARYGAHAMEMARAHTAEWLSISLAAEADDS